MKIPVSPDGTECLANLTREDVASICVGLSLLHASLAEKPDAFSSPEAAANMEAVLALFSEFSAAFRKMPATLDTEENHDC